MGSEQAVNANQNAHINREKTNINEDDSISESHNRILEKRERRHPLEREQERRLAPVEAEISSNNKSKELGR